MKVRQLVDEGGSIFATFRPSTSTANIVERSKTQIGLQRIRQYAKFGGELIPISQEDLAVMKRKANANRDFGCLSLIGFKPIDEIPWFHTTEATYFIYPNEDVVQGSREAFAHLHAAMLRKKVLALGEVLLRVHWTSRLVAVYPIEQLLEEDEDYEGDLPRQIRPPGMMVMMLPYEDDMRELDTDAAMKELQDRSQNFGSASGMLETDLVESKCLESCNHSVGSIATERAVEFATNMINQLRLEGKELGEDFENAALAEFFNYLESVALEVPQAGEDLIFDTRVDDDTILQVAGKQIEDFLSCLPEESSTLTRTTARKRKLPVADESGLDWEQLYRTDALADCKVPDLKSYLRSVGEPLTGNKGALVIRVTQHLRKRFSSEKNVGAAAIKLEEG